MKSILLSVLHIVQHRLCPVLIAASYLSLVKLLVPSHFYAMPIFADILIPFKCLLPEAPKTISHIPSAGA